jgi:hypothetical protein
MRTGILAIYSEFTGALTEVLAENAVGPTRRGRRPRPRAASKSIPTTVSSDIFWQSKRHATTG